MPSKTISGSSSYRSTSKILERIVEVTDAPRRMAPRNSKIPATITACFNVSDLDETVEAKAFATSFAPIPKA